MSADQCCNTTQFASARHAIDHLTAPKSEGGHGLDYEEHGMRDLYTHQLSGLHSETVQKERARKSR